MPSSPHILILGGGSGGFSAGIRAREKGARVTIVNDLLPVGGTCVNVGCIPSKYLVSSQIHLHQANHSPFPGIETRGKVKNFSLLVKSRDTLLDELRWEKYESLLSYYKMDYIQGKGRVLNGKTIEVNGKRIQGDGIIIAVGAKPSIPPIEGISDLPYYTSETILQAKKIPSSLIVLGGNYIGLEYGQTFSRLGSQVTILELLPRLLPSEDPLLSKGITEALQEEGVEIHCGVRIQKARRVSGGILLSGEKEGKPFEIQGESLLVAAGRTPQTKDLNLQEVGIQITPQGFIVVDEYLQTTLPSVFACGDCIGPPMFVYTAAYEGALAVENLLAEDPSQKTPRKEEGIPWVIFTDPPMAGVGPTEEELHRRGISCQCVVIPYSEIPRARLTGKKRGFIKLARDKETGLLLSGRVFGEGAGELITELYLTIAHKIPVHTLARTFHPYLTWSEGIKMASLAFEKKIEHLSCCAG